MLRMVVLLAIVLACPLARAERGVYAGASLDFHFAPGVMQVRNDFTPGFGGRIGGRFGVVAVDGWLSWGTPNGAGDFLHARGIDVKLHAPVHAHVSLYGRARWVSVDAAMTPLFASEQERYAATGYGAALGVQLHGKSPVLSLLFPWLTATGIPILARRGAVFVELACDRLRRPEAYFRERDLLPRYDRAFTLRLGWTWGSAS